MYEKHFTPEQLQRLEERRAVVTDARIAEIEAWAAHFRMVTLTIQRALGDPPSSLSTLAPGARPEAHLPLDGPSHLGDALAGPEAEP